MSLIPAAFYAPMGICMFTIVWGYFTDHFLTGYVNSVLTMWVYLVSWGVSPWRRLHFRLNSRDYIRERASPKHTEHSFALSTIRVTQPGAAFGSQAKPTDISVIVHRSTTSSHPQEKFDPNMRHVFEDSKLVRSLRFAFLVTRSILTLAKLEGYRHAFSVSKWNFGFEHVGS